MPFTARKIDEVHRAVDDPLGHVYDVELPYRRLGRCRMSEAVAAVIGTEQADVALALSVYEARKRQARDGIRAPWAGGGSRTPGRTRQAV